MTLSSLSHRFFLSLGGVLAVALIALVLIGRWVVMPALLEEEHLMATGELDRIERSLVHGQGNLLAHTRDWAHWDDSFQFVQDRHEVYAEAHMSRQMFEEMHYQAMLFYSADGSLHWVAGIDPDSDSYSSCATAAGACSWADRMVDAIQPTLASVPEEGLSLMLTSPWPAMVAANPIQPTSRIGPAGGWLVKIRLLDSRLEATLSTQTGLPILLDSLSLAALGERSEDIKPGGTQIEYTPEGEITASRFLTSHQPNDMLWLSTRIPRDHFRASIKTFRYALFWTGGLLLLLIAIVLALLEHMVLAPLRRFSRFTQQLHQSHESMDVPGPLIQRHDEIGTLAREFQALLAYQSQQTAKLLELSQHDSLTGIANRRLFDERLNQALTTLPADGDSDDLSVLMIDIDHFKLYNDHYGHPTGDSCLVAIAECMEQCLGSLGFLVARTGGEEFSILLPATTLDEAIEHAEALRQAIVDRALPHAASPTAKVVTVSIGIACCTPPGPCTSQQLMKTADQALYEAKGQGRNRIQAQQASQEESLET